MLSFQNVTKQSTEAHSRLALSFQRVMHSVISTRMLLHVRGVAEESRDWNNDIALSTKPLRIRKSVEIGLQRH